MKVTLPHFRRAGAILRLAAANWWQDRAMSLGAAISFYAVFSIAPMLLTVIAIAGLVFGREAAQGTIVAEIGGVIGDSGAAAIEAMVSSASGLEAGLIGTLLGASTFLFLATGTLVELQDALNIIWKAKPSKRSGFVVFLRSRILSFALLIGIGFLLLITLIMDAALSSLGSYLLVIAPGFAVFLLVVNVILSLCGSVLLFALIFKVLPNANVAWRDVWIGAVATGLLFAAGKLLIGLYLGQSNIASSFGAAASVITLLLWIYYSCQILLFGAEFTRAYAELQGSRAGKAQPPPGRH